MKILQRNTPTEPANQKHLTKIFWKQTNIWSQLNQSINTVTGIFKKIQSMTLKIKLS